MQLHQPEGTVIPADAPATTIHAWIPLSGMFGIGVDTSVVADVLSSTSRIAPLSGSAGSDEGVVSGILGLLRSIRPGSGVGRHQVKVHYGQSVCLSP